MWICFSSTHISCWRHYLLPNYCCWSSNFALLVEVWDISLLFDEWRICLAVRLNAIRRTYPCPVSQLTLTHSRHLASVAAPLLPPVADQRRNGGPVSFHLWSTSGGTNRAATEARCRLCVRSLLYRRWGGISMQNSCLERAVWKGLKRQRFRCTLKPSVYICIQNNRAKQTCILRYGRFVRQTAHI